MDKLKSPTNFVSTSNNYYKTNEDEKLIINVSGCIFKTYRKTLQKYPETLLGSSKMEFFYDKETKEYFFDRDSNIFRYILNYYRTDKLHFPKDECSYNYEPELEFFGILPEIMDDCCYKNYKNFKKEINDLNENGDDKLSDDNHKNEIKLKEKIWQILENHNSSTLGLIFYIISSFLLILCLIAYLIRNRMDFYIACDDSNDRAFRNSGVCDVRFHLYYLECILILFFTIEYIVRFFTAPNKLKFIISFFGICDLIALVPFYIGFIFTRGNVIPSFIVWKMFRLLKIFKFPNNVRAFQILAKTIKSSAMGICFFLLLFIIINLIFAIPLYFIEIYEPNASFPSIEHALWFTIITTTTVGYGDMLPNTPVGKIITVICALVGITTMAMLISSIILNFVQNYQHNQKLNKYKEQKKLKLAKIAIENRNLEISSF